MTLFWKQVKVKSCKTIQNRNRRLTVGHHENIAGGSGKVGVKRKWWGSAQPPYSPQGNGRQPPRVKPQG